MSFLHGIEVKEINDGPRLVRPVATSIIGIVGTAPDSQAAAVATLLTGDTADDNALTWTAVAGGADGNNVVIYLRNPFANSSALAITVANGLIIVDLETDAGGVIVSIADDISTAIPLDSAAAALVTVVDTGSSTGLGVVAPHAKQTPLAGGTDEAFPLNTPVLVAGSRTEAARLGTTGSLPDAMDGIFDQTGAAVVIVRVTADANPATELANVIGGATESARTGMHALLDAEALISISPKILIAPGYTDDLAAATEFVSIAEKLQAIVVIDGPDTTDAAVKLYRNNFGSNRVYLVDPAVKVFDTTLNAEVIKPLSSRVAGLIAKSDNERGVQWSPSNQVINGILGPSRAIDFQLGDPVSRANLLNEQEVTTIIRKEGWRLWGNRSCSDDPRWAFLPVRRVADLLNDSLARAHFWAIDNPITSNYIDSVLESVRAFIRILSAEDVIINGSVWVDPELNTPESIASGHIYFNFDFSAFAPAERITFRSHLVNDYIVEVLPVAS